MLARGSPDWWRGVAVPAGGLIRPPPSNSRGGEGRTRGGGQAHGAPRVRPQSHGVLDEPQGSAAAGEERFRRFGCASAAVGRVLFRWPPRRDVRGLVERATPPCPVPAMAPPGAGRPPTRVAAWADRR